MEFEPVTKEITQGMINNWADVIGDHNPIHIDEEYAKTTQFGGTIAHGTLLLAFVDQLMVRELSDRWLKGGWSFRSKIRLPVRPGDTVRVVANEVDGDINLEWLNQKDETFITGIVNFQ